MEFYRFTYKTKSKTKYTLVFLKDLNLIFNGDVNFKANKQTSNNKDIKKEN
jgi:hypothetical protein